MSGTIASLIPAAVGLALSPVPIIELILVIFSRRRVPNTVAFVLALMKHDSQADQARTTATNKSTNLVDTLPGRGSE